MSKTQLQTNNEKLTALITELEGKAAGGGSVETCTVSFTDNTRENLDKTATYMGPDGGVTMSWDGSTITVNKDTLIVIEGGYFSAYTLTITNAKLIKELGIIGVFEVTGDATIVLDD